MSENKAYAVKLDDDVRQNLQELIDASGKTAKDFITDLINLYVSQKNRESMGQIPELETLRHHVARIEEIYIATVKGAKDQAEANGIALKKAQEEAQMAKATAHEAEENAARAIKEAQDLADAARAQAALTREETEKELDEMHQTVVRERDAREQAVRLANLAEAAATAAKEKLAEIETLVEQAAEIREERDRLRQEREDLARQLARANEEREREAQAHESAIKAAKEELANQLRAAKERAEIEKDRAVLEAQRAAMEEIGKIREALALAREQKADLEVRLTQLAQSRPGPGVGGRQPKD